ncbi:rifamycin-inactivating phosphotransferase [Saccharopolyspora montiporae]|uniref:rifamycin-inactivating phosphotransferase n=1 Tax=Saccharopolyspora montiporae TaxID=2781240 RepID=UPI00351C2079
MLDLRDVDRSCTAVVGGKGAHLGELARLDGLHVPAGFCVTTGPFRRIMAEAPSMGGLLDRLDRVDPDDRDAIRALSAEIRAALEGTPFPDDLATAVTRALARVDAPAFSVRSSATAEDSDAASFAGQHDTSLNVVGPHAVLDHVRRCWASLFTDRAVVYRLRSGVDHRAVRMAVVVQEMVFPDASGVLFTADPVTSNRNVSAVEAGFGLGDGLVSGLVSPDVHAVRDGAVVGRTVAGKPLAVHADPRGGTRQRPVEPELQERPVLTDEQAVRLVQLGRRIEAHFGTPQDIEWCLADGTFQIVQSRPITTLFPIPAAEDRDNRVYVSVGHAQMMTDPIKPLGRSFWLMTTPAPMVEAGAHLFVDVTRRLAGRASRAELLDVFDTSDPLIGDALRTVADRGFVAPVEDESTDPPVPISTDPAEPIETDPAVVAELVQRAERSTAALRREIRAKSGTELLDFIRDDIGELQRLLLDPRSHQAVLASMDAASWLNERLHAWLGEQNAADVLTRSVPDNITSEMGLALLDVADAIRPHPEVVAFLRDVADDDFLDELPDLPGGRAARDAIRGWLDRYGMRCVGEIDITRPRWNEQPAGIVPAILGNIDNVEPGAGKRRFEQGRREAREKEQELLRRLRALPGGEAKAAEVKPVIDRLRTFAGYREYPKFCMVNRFSLYKQALLGEAGRLVREGALDGPEDVFFLAFPELHDVVRTGRVDPELIARRRAAFEAQRVRTPPRVLTSEGEAVAGSYRRAQAPPDALVGLPVSTGTVQGRARVVGDMAEAELETGDILVTAYTDPSWSPVLVTAAGLVTEVGGQMTHGSVIAREYGVPAVVGVQHATRLIRDGQRIRLDGTNGYVELLP